MVQWRRREVLALEIWVRFPAPLQKHINIHMDDIKEYKIISGPKMKVVLNANELIADGWQPFGSPTVSDHKDNSYPILFQAMVKYEQG